MSTTTIPVDDGSAAALRQIVDWHAQQVKAIEEGRQLIVAGRPLMVNDFRMEMSADMARGVRIGMSLALAYLGKLPFELIEDVPPGRPAASAAG